MSFKKLFLTAVFFLSAAFCPQKSFAQETIAVISSNSPYYLEALEGFKEVFGKPVTVLNAADNADLPPQALYVAFGTKAAKLNYPKNATVIYALSPGVWLARGTTRSAVKVFMIPTLGAIPRELKNIQPGLKRLAILYSSPAYDSFFDKLRSVSADFAVDILTFKVPDNGLPDILRNLQGKADAILLLPEPRLVNDQNLSLLKSYSLDNKIPYYTAIEGLVEKGATASLSVNFKEMGRTAAQAAQQILGGTLRENYVFPDRYEITVGKKAAETINLNISPEVLNRVKTVP
jgi:hypothetical protein